MSILSITILLPLLCALLLLPAKKDEHIKFIALFSCGLTMLASFMILWQYDCSSEGFQFVQKHALINAIEFEFFIGVDGMSVLLINLIAFLTFLSALYTCKGQISHLKEFIILLLLLESAVIGSFAALNILLFFIFFEISLVPMYLMIGLWGADNRIYASYKFFIYTLVGSVIFVICIMYLYSCLGTLSIPNLYKQSVLLNDSAQQWIWIGLFITFAIKIPMFPFHTWLPDAHVQAPTVGSVILAGVLLKLGGYGFLRILLPILPSASVKFAIYPMVLSVIAIIYASFVAMAQKDMKKMIAYSSIAHMGYVTAGIFSLNPLGIAGSIFQMLSHGLISAALFFSVGSMYERVHTKQIDSYGGLAKTMPLLAFFFMVFTLGSVGLPGTSGFIGEFMCLNGIFQNHHIIASISAFGVLLSAVYMLGLYKSVMFGEIINPQIGMLADIKFNERAIFFSLTVMIIALGIFPNIVNTFLESSVTTLIKVLHVR